MYETTIFKYWTEDDTELWSLGEWKRRTCTYDWLSFLPGGTFHIMMPKGVTQAEQQTVLVEEIWSKFRELKQLEFMEWSTK